MTEDDLTKIINLRAVLIKEFTRLNEYKRDSNAIMKQVEHASVLNDTIQTLDDILRPHVTFSN